MKQERSTWLGNFFGGNLGFLNYEILTIQHIPVKEMKAEAELMGLKWFDYRQLHPMKATYYFAKCYTVAYQDFYRKSLNAEAAQYVRFLKGHDFLEARENKSIWKLRQLCDRMGMRYDFFLGFAMKRHHKMMDCTGKIYAPRPAHLLCNEELIADAMLAWEEQCQISMQVARNPWYRVSNFNGHKDQLAHEAFVIAQINTRQHKQYSLHAALYLYDTVRIEEALRQFDAGLVDLAIKEVSLPD
jgi:hypothetical protein